MTASPLLALERLRWEFGPAAAARKRVLLERLARQRMPSARALRRLHELLCVLRAYPDDAELLARVNALLAGFAGRADLRRHRHALADSGIAGTTIHYRFFAGPAQWLAAGWPERLRLDRSDRSDRSDREAEARIARALPLLVTPAERAALLDHDLPGYAALDRVRGARAGQAAGDAAFLLRRIAALPGDTYTREACSDTLDASYLLLPGPGTPARGAAFFAAAPRGLQRQPLRRGRPDLRLEIARPPHAIRRLGPGPGAEAVALARAAMVTRARALEAFSYADARDAWLVDDGDGLAFALLGVLPGRRQALASMFGGLTLRNGVPIGYLQADVVGRSAALSFNTFETFRGGEAAPTFARLLAALHALLGVTSFSIEPYQLGLGNDEGLDSGAWWFYAKLGFAPRDAQAQRRARAEAARVARNPRHRSSPATLRALARHHLFFELDDARPHPLPPLAALAQRASARLSQCAGADRELALQQLGRDLLQRCGQPSLRGFNAAAREAWRRLVPLLALLDLDHWSAAERRALPELARAKAGRSEREFVALYNAHPRLDGALVAAAAAPASQ